MSLKSALLAALVAHYKMNDNAATTVVVDEKGSNGTSIRNTSLMHVAGKVDGALDFNGTDYITIPNNDAFDITTQDFTLSFWIKAPSQGANGTRLFLNYSFVTETGYVIHGDFATLSFLIHHNATIVESAAGENVFDDTWHHVACVADRDGNASIYVDGVLDVDSVNDISAVNFDISTGNDLVIGANHNIDYQNFYTGILDNFMIFNKALTTDEIAYLYSNGNGRETFPVRPSKFGRGWRW